MRQAIRITEQASKAASIEGRSSEAVSQAQRAQLWLTAYTNLGAGLAFFLGGACYCMAFVNVWLLPGTHLTRLALSAPATAKLQWWLSQCWSGLTLCSLQSVVWTPCL